MHIRDHQHLLDTAIAQHQQGHLAAAKALYETILHDEPRHFTALHLCGVIACQQEEYEQGIDLIKRALLLNPRSLSAHINLVNALEKINDNKAAIIYAAQMLVFEPSHLEALVKMAQLLEKLHLHQHALPFLNKAIAVKKEPSLHVMKGNVLLKENRFQEALASFKEAILLKPDLIDAYSNAGTTLMALNQPQEALHYYNDGLAINPHHDAIARNKALALRVQAGLMVERPSFYETPNLSIQEIIDQSEVLITLGEIEAAIAHIHAAILAHAHSADLYNQQGLVLSNAKRYEAAIDSFNHALSLHVDHIQAMINATYALMGLNRFEDAITMCERVLSFNQNNTLAINNMGSALVELNQKSRALTKFEQVVALDPNADFAKLNAAFCLLAMENYEQGLPLYELRWQGDLLKSKYYIPKPIWTGKETLAGKVIFLYGEQGFGDSFQFSRYIKLVAETGANILLGVNESVKSLFQRSFPYVTLTDTSTALPHLDYYCPLGSLPLAFNTTTATIPADVPYLIPDNERVTYWRKKLAGKKPLVGIVWRGNADNPVEAKRALPLPLLMSLTDMDARFISLKIDITAEEKKILDKHNVISIATEIHDFDDTAAIINNLDIIISTDTSVAHLAGALGKSVWILLALSADWRWHLNRDDSPWYPSAHLFRQPHLGDWQSVIINVRQYLQQWLMQHRG